MTAFHLQTHKPVAHGLNNVSVIAKQSITFLREVVSDIQDQFDHDELITIRGFFSSGTNWLRALVKRNCADLVFEYPADPYFPNGTTVDVDGLYGWKHGLMLEKELQRLLPRKSHKLIILSREAPTWVVSAFKMSAMERHPMSLNHKKRMFAVKKPADTGPGGKILRSMNKYINTVVDEVGVYGLFEQSYYDKEIRKKYRLRTPNVLAARTMVYRNWLKLLQLPELKGRVHFLRYEDLNANPFDEFRSMLEHLHVDGCVVNDTLSFDPITHRVKMGQEYLNISLEAKHPREEFCSTVTTQALYSEILSKLDLTLEAQLGYSYPSSREEYCKHALRNEEDINSQNRELLG